MPRATITYFSDMMLPEYVARLCLADSTLRASSWWNHRTRRFQAAPDACSAFQATVWQIQADVEIALTGGFIDG
jgi:hypothetical protein